MRKSYISVADIVSYQKRTNVDVTSGNFVNFDSEKIHEDEIFGRQDLLQFFSEDSKH